MRVLALCLVLALPSLAAAWSTPERGSQLRGDLMDALRPLAEWQLGAPLVFVVDDLRVAGDVAFANLGAVRPDGTAVDLRWTPAFARGVIDPEYMDGPQYQVLYRKSGQTWVAVHWVLGATDAWWYDPELCPQWAAVIPEACG